jgi:hypothetical protein
VHAKVNLNANSLFLYFHKHLIASHRLPCCSSIGFGLSLKCGTGNGRTGNIGEYIGEYHAYIFPLLKIFKRYYQIILK